jgi:signal transduction histidine kinase
MSSTIRDADTALLHSADNAPRVGHFYLDIATGRLHALNEVAHQLRAIGVPLAASDPAVADLRTARGQPVTADQLPITVALRDGRPLETEFVLLRPGRPERRLRCSATPLKDSGGRVGAVLASIIYHAPPPDWAAMAGLAHDLRTPLQTLQMMCHILEFRTLPDAERRQALQRLGSAAERSLKIAQELLDWCRTRGAADPVPRREWFPLEPLLRDMLNEQAPSAAEKALTLDAALVPVHGWQIHSERGRLARIVANLLVNAVRYTPTGGCVRLSAAWDNEDGARVLVLEVRDTGAGISPQEHESIFQPFERGQTGRDQDSSGSGVGLSVVDRLTQELGLRCEVQSAAGQGSRFSIRIPQQQLRMAPVGAPG